MITEKAKDNLITTKARLVARGYEENKSRIRSDSPTCMEDSVRMLLGIAAGKGWKIPYLDVKAAILLGKSIERDLFLQPPAKFRNKGMIWKLRKVVYDLCDASRSWYLKVVEVLTELGMTVGKLYKALFTFKTDALQGIVLVHVDDALYVGTRLFLSKVMEPFKRKLKVSRDDNIAFQYLGVSLCQTNAGIELSQKHYLEGMKPDLLPREALTDKE